MNLSDVRFVKGAFFGIFAHLADSALLAALMGAFAIGYMIASALTKDPTPEGEREAGE